MNNRKTFQTLVEQALSHWSEGRLSEAIAGLDSALKISPNSVDILLCLGRLHCEMGAFEAALVSIDQLLTLQPNLRDALLDKAAVLQSQRRFEDSLSCLERVIADDPRNAEAWLGKGIVAEQTGQLDAALRFIDHSIELAPESASAWSNRGNVLARLERLDESLSSHRKAVSLSDSPVLVSNLAVALDKSGETSEALELFDRALSVMPDHAESRLGRSHLLLSMHEFAEGWRDYEWRWKIAVLKSPPFHSDKPLWDGSRFEGRLLIWGEQGIGDQILHASMLDDLERLEQKVVCSIDPRLLDIFSRAYSQFEFVSSEKKIDVPYDAQIPIASLGKFFRQSIRDFPMDRQGYLSDDSARTLALKRNLPRSRQPIVGLSWKSGNASSGKSRSIDLDKLVSALCRQDANFINLQYGDTESELSALELHQYERFLNFSEIDRMNDIEGLLSLIKLCDVVVTISNSTAHLAGALGKEVWLLVPFADGRNWYWFPFEEQCLWYPSVKIITQQRAGEWDEPLSKVHHLLEDLIVG